MPKFWTLNICKEYIFLFNFILKIYITMEDKNWSEFEKYKCKLEDEWNKLLLDGKKHLGKTKAKNKQINLKR